MSKNRKRQQRESNKISLRRAITSGEHPNRESWFSDIRKPWATKQGKCRDKRKKFRKHKKVLDEKIT